MYPNLFYAFKDLLGLELPFLKLFQTFGFFVAIAFLAAAYTLTSELKRRERLGLLKAVPEKITKGKPVSTTDIIINGVIGFILGFKIIGIVSDWENVSQDLQSFVMSARGSLVGGIIVGAALAYLKYRSGQKNKAEKEVTVTELVHPYQRVPDFTVMAAVAGLIGAKVFHNLENWGDFVQDPIGSLLSFSGLTFYGGLIVASVVIIRYARKKNINVLQLIDSAAPGLMLAYGIGRMGCHFSGDGDWGIYNSAYVTDATGHVNQVDPSKFQEVLKANEQFFARQYGGLEHIPHAAFPKPSGLSFLPDWFFAYGYPHNVINEGVLMPGCTGRYCSVLPISVYPTALYEIIACLLLFALLWSIRKKIKVPGMVFGIYLVLNGIERFFIEKIRVNTKYDIFGIHPTQAEIISTLMVIGGAVLIWYCRKLYNSAKTIS
ncbi:prolipoprotein diacylglyceryl transferase [Chitinophaga sancti]|uniref:Prolipoprotein diacylglyceryl transferase n=1 Tax=Chitinophaga sancti TaxID=1004 RepID=A0A1K1LVM0_9BACT|nr:prolipoprotein diacylglyceryl transferase family protein [Chitinophaga sancti]WQD64812.1 prolipoprotein diacylglyceryl transferase family protein [Chitinophaga sancti]WQG89564.1 prolipoprotein diacylglyceryl transferase [Chitinophaga sancti]SFW14916.1 Prolipoprotein diacylglyceryl transferase [Chitinophaga sancti]